MLLQAFELLEWPGTRDFSGDPWGSPETVNEAKKSVLSHRASLTGSAPTVLFSISDAQESVAKAGRDFEQQGNCTARHPSDERMPSPKW
jgi:hypothetical protein